MSDDEEDCKYSNCEIGSNDSNSDDSDMSKPDSKKSDEGDEGQQEGTSPEKEEICRNVQKSGEFKASLDSSKSPEKEQQISQSFQNSSINVESSLSVQIEENSSSAKVDKDLDKRLQDGSKDSEEREGDENSQSSIEKKIINQFQIDKQEFPPSIAPKLGSAVPSGAAASIQSSQLKTEHQNNSTLLILDQQSLILYPRMLIFEDEDIFSLQNQDIMHNQELDGQKRKEEVNQEKDYIEYSQQSNVSVIHMDQEPQLYSLQEFQLAQFVKNLDYLVLVFEKEKQKEKNDETTINELEVMISSSLGSITILLEKKNMENKFYHLISRKLKTFCQQETKFLLDLEQESQKQELIRRNLRLNDQQIQRIKIIPEIYEKFIQKAQPNTDQNIQTLGLMGGYQYEDDIILVDSLFIPKQDCQSDSCRTTEKSQQKQQQLYYQIEPQESENEAMLEFFDQNNRQLVVWIHTHPSHVKIDFFQFKSSILKGQFLSSVDLHTQYSYQTQSPAGNMIAIVYSPDNQVKMSGYKLNENGIQEISKCKQSSHHEGHSEMKQICEILTEQQLLLEKYDQELIKSNIKDNR